MWRVSKVYTILVLKNFFCSLVRSWSSVASKYQGNRWLCLDHEAILESSGGMDPLDMGAEWLLAARTYKALRYGSKRSGASGSLAMPEEFYFPENFQLASDPFFDAIYWSQLWVLH